ACVSWLGAQQPPRWLAPAACIAAVGDLLEPFAQRGRCDLVSRGRASKIGERACGVAVAEVESREGLRARSKRAESLESVLATRTYRAVLAVLAHADRLVDPANRGLA